MLNILKEILPNVFILSKELYSALLDTLYMVIISGVFALIFGLILGVILIVTRKDDILENKYIHSILNKVINIFRSIPFIILITMLVPISRLLVGTSIGKEAAIPALVIGTIPFFARQIELALGEVDQGLIEASIAIGLSPIKIIYKVYIKEAIPSIVRGTTITIISLVGLTTIAGAIGAGGLGDFAIRYGYQRNKLDITFISVIIILIIVSLIQFIGNNVIKKTSH
ncbi:MAG: methionine ABC transporter permease [Erysipelotrichaceae bacterium]